MTTNEQREALKQVYRAPAWIKRVNAMADDQVQAIFLRLKQQKKL